MVYILLFLYAFPAIVNAIFIYFEIRKTGLKLSDAWVPLAVIPIPFLNIICMFVMLNEYAENNDRMIIKPWSKK